MPSSFDSFSDGDIIHASHVMEIHEPIQNLERGAAFYAGTSSGTSIAYTAALSPAPDSPYQGGMIVNFKVHTANAAGSPDVTLNINSVGAKPIVKEGGVSLEAGDLKADQVVSVIYDDVAEQFHLISPGSMTSISSLDDLSDVAISSPSANQVLHYDGSQFVNGNLAVSDMPVFSGSTEGPFFGAKPIAFQNLSLGSGNSDFGPVPSGKRWLWLGAQIVNNSGGGVNVTPQFKVGSTYYTISSTASVPTSSQAGMAVHPAPYLEAGEYFSILTSGTGLQLVSMAVLEFDSTSPAKSARVLSLASGNNTIYTCPVGKRAIMCGRHTQGSYAFVPGPYGFHYRNDSGATRTYYWNMVASGGSVIAPGSGSNCPTAASGSASTGTTSALQGVIIYMFNPGDFLNINTNASTSQQHAWVNLIEVPG